VAVSNTTFSASVAFLGRLASAGLEPLTVQIARAISFYIPISSDGEKRLNEATSRMRTSTIGKVIKFGFGVQNILQTLLQTSQGASSVALMGCLCEGHTPSYAAEVVYELLKITGIPLEITPSFSQWEIYAQLCAGTFRTSTFGKQIQQLRRNLDGRSYGRLSISNGRTYPVNAMDVAKILQALGSILTGEVDRIEIIGREECCWVVALCDFLLGLRVRLRDETGTLYQNYSSNDIAQVEVKFVHYFHSDMICTAKTFQLGQNVDELLCREELLYRGDKSLSSAPSQLLGRLEWDAMVQDSFGENWEEVLRIIGNPFVKFFIAAAAICCSGSLIRRYPSTTSFIDKATISIPELKPLHETLMEELYQAESHSCHEKEYARMYVEAAKKISAFCSHTRTCSHDKGRCVNVAMCNTIFLLVVLIGELVFDDELTPTISGIKLLFNDVFNNTSFSDYTPVLDPPRRQKDVPKGYVGSISSIEEATDYSAESSRHQRREKGPRHKLYGADRADPIRIRSHLLSFCRPESRDVLSHLPLQFSRLFKCSIGLFSGAEVQGNFSNSVQAVAKHGIYCHLHALLEISEQYEEGARIHIGCGHIQYRNKRYDGIYDQDQDKIGGASDLAVKYATMSFSSRPEFNSYADENKTLRYWYEVKVEGQTYAVNPVHLLEKLAKASSHKLHHSPFLYLGHVGEELSSIFDCLVKTVANKHLQSVSAGLDDTLRRCLAALYIDSYVVFITIEEIRLFIIHFFEERYGRMIDSRNVEYIKGSFTKDLEKRLDFK
jgi:hypothetical protein